MRSNFSAYLLANRSIIASAVWSGARIKNLHAVRLGLLGGGGAFAVENYDDANARIVLVIAQFFDEGIACE